eukprot:TRINITY_DN23675_c0_g3_i1.p1 TRINITY_DN23675_c0_g3~~TRINITY_DN23675_c0_g3_i1.p1  ORF type:complete len:398 (+),score=56.39 TRINITY_DN23675_c0_g3_i1:83-1276(+)
MNRSFGDESFSALEPAYVMPVSWQYFSECSDYSVERHAAITNWQPVSFGTCSWLISNELTQEDSGIQHAFDAPSVYTVRLQHLPRKMRSQAMLDTMMEQAGLGMSLMSFDVEDCDGVLLHFQDEASAGLCIKHLNGRIWGGAKIVASLAPDLQNLPTVSPSIGYGELKLGTNVFADDAVACPSEPIKVTPSDCYDTNGSGVMLPPGLDATNVFSIQTEEEKGSPSASATTVRLENLPNELCSYTMVSAMLEQLGLEDKVLSCDLEEGARVLITFASAAAAKVCINHCHQRSWSGRKADPVVAKIVETPCNAEDARSDVASIVVDSASAAQSSFAHTCASSPSQELSSSPGVLPDPLYLRKTNVSKSAASVEKVSDISSASHEDASTDDGGCLSDASV